MSFSNEEAIDELMRRLDQDGISCVTVSDGTVFAISTQMLEDLLKQSQASGCVMVFVKRHIPSGNEA